MNNMENHINRQMDITWDILHELSIRYNTTLREINTLVWNRVYDIIWDLEHNFKWDGSNDLTQ